MRIGDQDWKNLTSCFFNIIHRASIEKWQAKKKGNSGQEGRLKEEGKKLANTRGYPGDDGWMDFNAVIRLRA